MSRGEFLELKAHLAAIRGYTVGDYRRRITALAAAPPADIPPNEPQQLARYLAMARALYRECPELVVFESAELDAYLAEAS